MGPTCSFFKQRQHRLIDVVVDTLRVTVVSNEEQVIDGRVLLTLPQGQTEPGSYRECAQLKRQALLYLCVVKLDSPRC